MPTIVGTNQDSVRHDGILKIANKIGHHADNCWHRSGFRPDEGFHVESGFKRGNRDSNEGILRHDGILKIATKIGYHADNCWHRSGFRQTTKQRQH